MVTTYVQFYTCTLLWDDHLPMSPSLRYILIGRTVLSAMTTCTTVLRVFTGTVRWAWWKLVLIILHLLTTYVRDTIICVVSDDVSTEEIGRKWMIAISYNWEISGHQFPRNRFCSICSAVGNEWNRTLLVVWPWFILSKRFCKRVNSKKRNIRKQKKSIK